MSGMEGKESCECSSKSLRDSSEACRIIVIFRDKGTGGVEGCEAFMDNLELCRKSTGGILASESLEISDKLARGASGLETGLGFCLPFKNLRLILDWLVGLVGEHRESSGEASLVVDLVKMPEMVCMKVFLELPLSLDFCGEAGSEFSSEETIPSSFSMSLRADEDFFISVFLVFRATGIPNLAGSVKRKFLSIQ